MKNPQPILTATNLVTSYGEHKVLDKLSLTVESGEIVMLVGANGAGKSTLLKALFGLVPLQEGTLKIANEAINPVPHLMVELGLSFVPQDLRVFAEMTVAENLRIGAFILNDKALVNQRLNEIYKLFPILKTKHKEIAGTLSGGQRQILALGRSMMLNPKILLLDEPSVGLAPKVVSEVFSKIQQINKTYGTTIIIVEHNLKSLLKVADRAIILYKGKIAKEGTPAELLKSKMLEEVFFGTLA